MKPITSTAEAAGFAQDIGGLVANTKRHVHDAIESLGAPVNDDDPHAGEAVLAMVKALNLLACIEENLAEVIEQGSSGRPEAQQTEVMS